MGPYIDIIAIYRTGILLHHRRCCQKPAMAAANWPIGPKLKTYLYLLNTYLSTHLVQLVVIVLRLVDGTTSSKKA